MATSKGRSSPRWRQRARQLAALVAALGLMTWGMATASAATVERETFTETWDVVAWDCGYPMSVVGGGTQAWQFRTDKRNSDVVFVTLNYDFKETWTTADGRSFVLSGNGLAKDVRAKSLGGSLYEFTYHESGQPVVVSDSSGKVLYRDRGVLSVSFTFDFADGSDNFVGLKVAGPHPMFDFDLCEAVQPLVGGDSDNYLAARPLGSTASGMGYYEYLPPSYDDAGASSPLLVFLHGYGETGDGTPDAVHNLLWAGIPRFIAVGGWPTDRPLVVLAPQHVEEAPGFDFASCDGVPWGGSCNMQVQHDNNHASPAFCTTPDEVHDFIDYAVAVYNVDPKRVYVTGLSCGGFGAWEYLAKYGDEQVAAAIPIAGEGRPAWATAGCGLGSVPIWAFHGALDDVVDPQGSIEPLTDLQDCLGVPADEARLTVYDDLWHEGWDEAYSGSRGEDIYAWMLNFSQP